MLPSERRTQILDLVARQGVVQVSDLSDQFRVSEVTIRSDLDLLASQGLLVRERGGAVVNSAANHLVAYEQRARLNTEQKRRIGVAAARLVRAGDTIIMDAGTTVMAMARNMRSLPGLIVLTNGLNIATEVGALINVHVIVLGGLMNRETMSTAGPHAEWALKDTVAQKLFLGIRSVDVKAGLTDLSRETVSVKKAMIRSAKQVILLADSMKWGRVSFNEVGALSAIHTIITDSGLKEDTRVEIERAGIELIIV
jgi:DeoR family transcriptional regulator of aga operon